MLIKRELPSDIEKKEFVIQSRGLKRSVVFNINYLYVNNICYKIKNFILDLFNHQVIVP